MYLRYFLNSSSELSGQITPDASAGDMTAMLTHAVWMRTGCKQLSWAAAAGEGGWWRQCSHFLKPTTPLKTESCLSIEFPIELRLTSGHIITLVLCCLLPPHCQNVWTPSASVETRRRCYTLSRVTRERGKRLKERRTLIWRYSSQNSKLRDSLVGREGWQFKAFTHDTKKTCWWGLKAQSWHLPGAKLIDVRPGLQNTLLGFIAIEEPLGCQLLENYQIPTRGSPHGGL